MTFHEGIQIFAWLCVIAGMLAFLGIAHHYRLR
jgi:hypothetical protein